MPKRGKKNNLLGAWAFLIGVILAVIAGLFQSSIGGAVWLSVVLVIIGLIVGFLNVGSKDTNTFLLAAVSLVIVSFMGSPALSIISWVEGILSALLVMFVPATVVVALKAVFTIAKD